MADALNIDRYLGHTLNRISLVGIELEGGWQVLPPGTQLAHDGSVNLRNVEVPLQGIGELPSEPMPPIKMAAWMRKFYPSHHNSTCGLHMHMSFKSALHYGQLMIPEYQETIFEYMIRWAKEEKFPKTHALWKRLDGTNQYCRKIFAADLQATKSSKSHSMDQPGNRYTAINYCHGLHGTMECRLLPMMDDAETAIRALRHIMDITNACLVVTAKKEARLKASSEVKGGEDSWVEERKVII